MRLFNGADARIRTGDLILTNEANRIFILKGELTLNTYFDPDIITHINGVFATLTELGVGPEDGFTISDDTEAWTDFISSDKLLKLVPTYVYLKVRLAFDPPATTAVLESFDRQAKECEWRINVVAERESWGLDSD